MAGNNPLQALSRMVRRWWQDIRRAADEPLLGTLAGYDPARLINDGVDYSLPVAMPREVRRAWGGWTQQQRSAWLEADRANWRFQFDSPQRTSADLPVQMPNEDPLAEWDMATRRAVLENCHMAYMRNPIVNAGVNYTKAFVVGEGMRLTVKNEAVHEVLEAFRTHPDNPVSEYERSFVTDLQIDGELFIRFFEEGGETVIVPLRPWEVEEIRTEAGFYRRPIEYHVVREVRDGTGRVTQETEDIPAAQVHHAAINRRSYDQRGRSDVYVILPWAKAYKDWLEDRARQNYWRNSLLYKVVVDTTNQATLAAVAARWRKPPAPGSVAVESSKVQIDAVTNPTGADGQGEDGRQIKLMTAVGLQLPEYMLADGENANLASTNNQELPALTKFGEYQRIMIEQVWKPVFRRVLENAIAAGVLPDEVEEQDADFEPVLDDEGKTSTIPTLEAFDVTYEPLSQDDPFNMAQALAIAYDNNWVSAETASTEMGYDYVRETKAMDREMQQQRDRIAQGLVPPMPGMNPDGTPMEPGADDDDDATQERAA